MTWLLQAIVAAYVLAVAFMPLSHHDVVCHAKSTTHCTSCVVGASAEPAGAAAGAAPCHLNDLGAAAAGHRVVAHGIMLGVSAGRAPPAIL